MNELVDVHMFLVFMYVSGVCVYNYVSSVGVYNYVSGVGVYYVVDAGLCI